MGNYIALEIVKEMKKKNIQIKGANILLLGITFKENCTDITNTKAVDIYKGLKAYNSNIDVYDPWASYEEVREELGIELTSNLTEKKYDSIVLVVAHNEFLALDLSKIKKADSIVYDVKGVLDKEDIDKRL